MPLPPVFKQEEPVKAKVSGLPAPASGAAAVTNSCAHKEWLCGELIITGRWPLWYIENPPDELGWQWHICALCGYAKLVDEGRGGGVKRTAWVGMHATGWLGRIEREVDAEAVVEPTPLRLPMDVILPPKVDVPPVAPPLRGFQVVLHESQTTGWMRSEEQYDQFAAETKRHEAEMQERDAEIGELMREAAQLQEALDGVRLRLRVASVQKFNSELLFENAGLRRELEALKGGAG